MAIDNDSPKYPLVLSDRTELVGIPSKAKGYFFDLHDVIWILDKNISINLSVLHNFLSEHSLFGCLQTLKFYATTLSSSHTKNVIERLQHMLRETKVNEITDVALINYRASLSSSTEWYLGVLRGFFKRWYSLGYPGISKEIVNLLDGWRLKGNRKGDAVKRQDPVQGPLTDIELQAFNEGVVKAYELGRITMFELAISLTMSNTGRRPIQISHLRVCDVICGRNGKDEPVYFLNVPRGKQGDGFRSQFKAFAITHDLWAILMAQAKSSLLLIERKLKFKHQERESSQLTLFSEGGFDFEEQDRQQAPLFPDQNFALKINSLAEYREFLNTDKIHISSAAVTDTLQIVIEEIDVKSERTGDSLWVNARRFRYTTGTRAAREGYGDLLIAELLDHNDTQNVGVYVKNVPEHVQRLDEAMGLRLAPLAQAFAGVLVDSEKAAIRGDDSTSRVRTDEGKGVGNCGEYGFCDAGVPVPCYTCMHFQPWVDGPHDEVYKALLKERDSIREISGDLEVAAILDRSILAVADVILRCDKRKAEMTKPDGVNDV